MISIDADAALDRFTTVTKRAGLVAGLAGVDSGALPSRCHADGTLRRLKETALVAFADRGFHAVSVRDLARAMGLQASSLDTHVTSKQQLLAELVRIGHE